jgi:hypothetical protein
MRGVQAHQREQGLHGGQRGRRMRGEQTGADEALRDGGLAGEEGRADFRRAHAADGAQGEGELRFDGELRMKADKEHAQRVIGELKTMRPEVRGERGDEPRPLAAEEIVRHEAGAALAGGAHGCSSSAGGPPSTSIARWSSDSCQPR